MNILNNYQNKSMCKRELSNFILFSLGKLISLFGTYIYTFAIGLYILRLTGSGLSFAANLVSSSLPLVIISPFAGVLADKLNKKLLVVLMDLLNGLLMIGIYFISSSYGLNLTMIYVSTFIMNSFMTIFDTSLESAKPHIVSENRLMSINSISKIIQSLSTILGPMIGGLVFAFIDIRLFILFNGISFILSGISEAFIDFRLNYKEPGEEEKSEINFLRDIKQGFKYMVNKKEIFNLIIVFTFLNFSLGLSISVPLPVIINNILKLSPKHFGIIQGAFPVGLILGAIFVKRVSMLLPYRRLLTLMSLIIGICIIMIGIPVLPFNISINKIFLLIYYSLVISIVGIAIAFVDIPLLSILQKNISDEYRGRVLSLSMSLGKIVLPLAFLLSGVLINILPMYLLQGIGSMVLLISSIVASKNSSKGNFNFKKVFSDMIKGNIIFFAVELLLWLIIRPSSLEVFLLIWIFIPFLLLIDNIFSNRTINLSKPLISTGYYKLGMERNNREKDFFKNKIRIYGGILDSLNLVYIVFLVINIMVYILIIPK